MSDSAEIQRDGISSYEVDNYGYLTPVNYSTMAMGTTRASINKRTSDINRTMIDYSWITLLAIYSMQFNKGNFTFTYVVWGIIVTLRY